MSILGIAIAGLMAVTGCGGASPQTPTTPSPVQPSTFNLTGTIIGDFSGVPLAAARVAIADGPNSGRATNSNTSGAFSLTGLARSGFTVEVSATGFVTTSRGITLDKDVQLDVRLASTFSPPDGVSFPQNNLSREDCPSPGTWPTAIAGYGHKTTFDWPPSQDPAVIGYQLVVQGSGNPALDIEVRTPPYMWVSCYSFVTDAFLTGWTWKVRTRSATGGLGPFQTMNFTYQSCRLSDGSRCRVR
ncbi:MAG: carboxypeptidase-like regulatory domain-containing protein [Vicinamibacterales bacterium]